MQKELTVGEVAILRNPDYAIARAFRSKEVLSICSRLRDRGLIEFDPFDGVIKLTDVGRKALVDHIQRS